MRIAIVSTPFISLPPHGYGGTELFCHELSQGLRLAGHDITVFATGTSETLCKLEYLYAEPIWPPTAGDQLNHVSWAFSHIREGKYDIVHLNTELGIALTPMLRNAIVHTIHHVRTPDISRLYARHPNVQFVAISERQRSLEVSLPNITVIHHGISENRYPPSLEDNGYLVHLGRYCEEKGTAAAIQVAIRAGMQIRLAGRVHEQDQAYYREQVVPYLQHPLVSECGEVDFAPKIELLGKARALVCPLTWEEPFGLVAVEAMLLGTPVLGYERGAFPEIVDQGITGFLAAEGEVDRLVEFAKSLNSFNRQRCADRARERFSVKRMVAAYEALYRRILEGRYLSGAA